MNKCKTCKYYNGNKDAFGYCSISSSKNGAPNVIPTLTYAIDYDSYRASLQVSPSYGGVQHTKL